MSRVFRLTHDFPAPLSTDVFPVAMPMCDNWCLSSCHASVWPCCLAAGSGYWMPASISSSPPNPHVPLADPDRVLRPKSSFVLLFASPKWRVWFGQALKKQKEQEERLALEQAKAQKEKDKLDREKIKAKIEQDRLERLAAKGIKPEEAKAAAQKDKPVDPLKEKKLNLSSKLRDIIGFHRNDPSTPNPATKALETATKYVDNIANNPTEEKFRAINMENAAFQRLVGGKKGGPEMMAAIGFMEEGGKLVMKDIDVEWLKFVSTELQLAAKRGPFY